MKYKWFFDESGVLTECEPKLDGDTKLEFAPESGEMFYRAKLTNALTFQYEFDDILSKGFAYTHIVVLQRYNDNESDFVEVWRGKFTLTDCTINYDRNTIEVSPATIDRYTDVMAAMETDYNIVKLKVATSPVTINVRPCLQIYCCGDTKLTNYVGETFWDASCDSNIVDDELQNTYHFAKIGEVFAVYFEEYVPFDNPRKVIAYTNNTVRDENNKIYLTGSDGHTYICNVWQNGNERRYTVLGDDDATWLFEAYYFDYQFDHIYENPSLLVAPNALSQWSAVYSRALLQTELAQISLLDTVCTTYDIPANDIAGAVNMNFNKVAPIPTACVHFLSSTTVSDNPTEWGQSYTDQYFIRPTVSGYHLMPVAPAQWKYASLWYYPYYRYSVNIDNYSANRTIKDGYDLRNTIARLLQKTGWNGQYVISGVFGSQGYVGNNLLPIITPKSNVISSYYDTPAQNAPISLAKIFSMLKQAYKVYWHIDENNNLHLEHISYYQNGYSYTDLPQTLVDLESDLHTRTKHSKAYGQNVVKFDKSGMPCVISFGWMDKQTVPFDGYDIKALDAYIEQGLKEENLVGDFSTDVDFVLSSPNDVSKDGFFLFALPKIGGSYSNTLKIEKINITDENGDNYDVTIQNADAAFCKIHKTFWRYSMPCENLQINNVPDTALTTGRFKTQTLEFADLSMADVIGDVDNCIKLIKTQQGYGAISKLSINLDSLTTTADLVFTLMGRKYYLKGAALNGTLTITLNGEQITINVENNRFVYGYTEPINELKFANTDVVSVDFADTDTLDNLISCDSMFDGCEELLAVDFGNKTFGAVTSANNMFRGCVALTTLICPDSSTWKADLDFSDCPALTLESFYDLIKFLYYYNSGVHTITPNSTMWNALDSDIQDDLIAKATERGWTINIPAQYSVTGESTSSTVYATINGTAVEIPVTGGVWSYDYNAAITLISFENDSNLTSVDFSLSDGLAGLTTLADAFKNCSALTSVDFSNCDLSNVVSATDTFAGCASLTELIVPAGTWKPDVDLSDTAMVYADMLSTIGILYTYATGTHTITFNQTYWDTLTPSQQQTISDAAQLKGWTTNAPIIVYVIKGTSTNVNGTETFNIQFINDGDSLPSPMETIVCDVDANGNWEFNYFGKKIYQLGGNVINVPFANGSTTLLTCDFSQAESDEMVAMTKHQSSDTYHSAFVGCSALQSVSFANLTLAKVTYAPYLFRNCTSLQVVDFSFATFESLTDGGGMFVGCSSLTTIRWSENLNLNNLIEIAKYGGGFFNGCAALTNDSIVEFTKQTFQNIAGTYALSMFRGCTSLTQISFPNATFGGYGPINNFFYGCSNLTSLSMPKATFDAATNATDMFRGCSKLTTVDLPMVTFRNLTNAQGMFRDSTLIASILMPNATFEKVTNSQNTFLNNNALTNIDVPQNSTAILPTSTAANAPMYLRYSPLTYQSMLKVANWLSDLSGQTAHTCTFKTTAWNALSAAEQTTIDGILSGKNWTRAIA